MRGGVLPVFFVITGLINGSNGLLGISLQIQMEFLFFAVKVSVCL